MDLQDILDDYQTLPEYSGVLLKDVNQISLFGDRPIHVAAVRGSIPELEALVSAGAHVNIAGEHGYTPLHSAVEQGMLEAATWLLEHGAIKSAVNDRDMTPFDLAIDLDEEELAALLR